MTIYDILKDTAYKTEQFSKEAIERLNSRIIEKRFMENRLSTKLQFSSPETKKIGH